MYDAPRTERRQVRPAPRRTRPTAAGWIAVAIWGLFAMLAALGTVGAVSAFSRYTDGLPSLDELDRIAFAEQSVITDRNGVELARFGGEKREVVAFEDIPPIIVDAQTAIEDKTFWENAGFDPLAIGAAALDSIRGNSRGASTITQQLVRQRLLDPELVQDPKRQVERKLKEIVQSIRLTQRYPGVEGKQKIIAAYLNQNYYGNQSYGVKAAAKSYFGITDLEKVTPAQAAILAALVKSPSNYDLVRNATEDCPPADEDENGDCLPKKTRLIVPTETTIVQRRNLVLDLLADGRANLSRDRYSAADFEAAKSEEVELARQTAPRWVAPHFVWAVQQELAAELCTDEAGSCQALEAGGLRITTTLDADLQKIAEKWVQAAAVVPNVSLKNQQARWKALGLPGAVPQWVKNLRGKDVRNGALVALDYETGQLVAYVGSANYYATKSTKQFQAKYDVVGNGYRQPGSAFKPFNYLTGIHDKVFTAGTMFMDTATDFGGNFTPANADNLERGPVRARSALQFSLNIPAVKAAQVNSPEHLFSRAQDYGMVFASDQPTLGLSIALGVEEVRPVDLVTAYGTLANGGRKVPHTTILSVTNQLGDDILRWVEPEGEQVASPQASYIVTDMLAGNTNPRVNPFWGAFAVDGPGDERRPATLKTGTNTDAKDLNAYGFIAPPTDAGRDAGEFALAVGAWNGNSDNTVVSKDDPVFSIDVTTYVWQGFLQEATASWAINDFARPEGLVRAEIDAFTGLLPRPGSPTVNEWFIAGTEPTATLPEGVCGQAVLEHPRMFESKYRNWMTADLDWIERAKRGPGTAGGVNRTRTAYFYNGAFVPFGRTWGALVEGRGCTAPSPSVTCYPVPTPDPSGNVPSFSVPSADPSANIVFEPCATPSAAPSEAPSASLEPSAAPSVEVTSTPPPAPTPTPAVTPPPTPEPQPTPTPEPEPSAAAPSGAAPAP